MKRLLETLGTGLILAAIFTASFIFFFQRAQQRSQKEPFFLTAAALNSQLPKADLVNISGTVLEDERLRHGKVVLVFTLLDCPACSQESDFLKTVVGRRKDVSFYGVIPFGDKESALERAGSKYPFATFFDEGSTLSQSLEVYQVPVKVFLEDGVIKKTWVGSTGDKRRQDEFDQWLDSL